MSRKTAIVVGASSGIGRQLSKVLVREGYHVGVAARRLDLLQTLCEELSPKAIPCQLDLAKPDLARPALTGLIQQLKGVDLFVLAAADTRLNPKLRWDRQVQQIDTNVRGFAFAATEATEHFLVQGHGHLVGISSIGGLRGSARSTAYAATKAFVSKYLDGLRYFVEKKGVPIRITEIQPGFVDVGYSDPKAFMAMPVHKAAELIWRAIRQGKKHTYLGFRGKFTACLVKTLPDFIWRRLEV